MRILIAILGLCAASCAPMNAVEPRGAAARETGWRAQATAADRSRLRAWRSAWTAALAKARAGGHARDLAREGALLEPDLALANAALPPGAYACRVVKLGAKGGGTLDYVAYPPFECRVRMESGVLSLTKMTGSQRPVGLLFPESDTRQVFLGTLLLGDEAMAQPYGRDATRDMAGVVERIGPSRWRLVLPYPHFESMLDVVELVPQP